MSSSWPSASQIEAELKERGAREVSRCEKRRLAPGLAMRDGWRGLAPRRYERGVNTADAPKACSASGTAIEPSAC